MASLTEELNFELQYSILINFSGNSHMQLAATSWAAGAELQPRARRAWETVAEAPQALPVTAPKPWIRPSFGYEELWVDGGSSSTLRSGQTGGF